MKIEKIPDYSALKVDLEIHSSPVSSIHKPLLSPDKTSRPPQPPGSSASFSFCLAVNFSVGYQHVPGSILSNFSWWLSLGIVSNILKYFQGTVLQLSCEFEAARLPSNNPLCNTVNFRCIYIGIPELGEYYLVAIL